MASVPAMAAATSPATMAGDLARPQAPTVKPSAPVLWWGCRRHLPRFLRLPDHRLGHGPELRAGADGSRRAADVDEGGAHHLDRGRHPARTSSCSGVLVQPWRRDGRPSTDGLMALACLCLVVQDPWSSYVQHWFTYNAYLPNMGSWVNEIPGWMAFGAPGEQVPEPILWSPFMYCYAFFAITVLGCWQMRLGQAALAAGRRRCACSARASSSCASWTSCSRACCSCRSASTPTTVGTGASSPTPTTSSRSTRRSSRARCSPACRASATSSTTAAGRSPSAGSTTSRRPSMQQTGLRFLAIFGAFSVTVLACYNIPSARSWPRTRPRGRGRAEALLPHGRHLRHRHPAGLPGSGRPGQPRRRHGPARSDEGGPVLHTRLRSFQRARVLAGWVVGR